MCAVQRGTLPGPHCFSCAIVVQPTSLGEGWGAGVGVDARVYRQLRNTPAVPFCSPHTLLLFLLSFARPTRLFNCFRAADLCTQHTKPRSQQGSPCGALCVGVLITVRSALCWEWCWGRAHTRTYLHSITSHKTNIYVTFKLKLTVKPCRSGFDRGLGLISPTQKTQKNTKK